MMINLLIIEDDPKQLEIYTDALDNYEKSNGKTFEIIIKKSYDEWIKDLYNSKYDSAIIDLKLDKQKKDAEGNDIIRSIQKNLRYPITVITGYPGDLDPDLNNDNIFFRVIKRDELIFKDLISDIINLYNTGITKILGGRGKIEHYLTEIFWKHISHTLESWINLENPEKSLLRYILNHIAEYLELDDAGGFDDYLPTEVYISPPIKDRVFTGDILKKKNEELITVILTPVCDLAQSKAKNIILAEIEPLNTGIVKDNKTIFLREASTEKQKEDAIINLNKLISNSFSNKYHFLPPCKIFAGGLINFQKIQSFRITDLSANYDKIVSITTPFIKDIIARFSYYYSRQGSPDFNITSIFNTITAA